MGKITNLVMFLVWLVFAAILLGGEFISAGEWLISTSILIGLYFFRED